MTNLALDGRLLYYSLKKVVIKVKRTGKWCRIDPVNRAFIKVFLSLKLRKIKSLTLIRIVVRMIKTLKEIVSKESELIKEGVYEAWKISKIATKWGHREAYNWRNEKSFIIYQAINQRWINRLFNGANHI